MDVCKQASIAMSVAQALDASGGWEAKSWAFFFFFFGKMISFALLRLREGFNDTHDFAFCFLLLLDQDSGHCAI